MHKTRPLSRRLILLPAIAVLLAFPARGTVLAVNAAVWRDLGRWVDNGAVLVHDENGRVLLDYHSERVFIPASLVKLYTALFALNKLGADFRFRTDIYTNAQGDLGIKGWGDPHLISEEIHRIAEELKDKGIKTVRRIMLDQTAFADTIRVEGQSNSLNPYDAINSALIVNYNTLFLGRRKNGIVYSAEPVTPLTSLSRELGKTLEPGTEDRFNLSTDPQNISRYAAELFGEILKQHGIAVNGQYGGETRMDGRWRHVCTHYSSVPLRQIIQGLLKYSNNLIANQIYLVAGAETAGYPATLQKAGVVFQDFFKKHFPGYARRTVIDEASGISRNNRMSAAAIMAVLEEFRPWADLLDLKKGALLKSGTLTGVYNYAGYLKKQKGYHPFVILLNQSRNVRGLILRILEKL